MSQTRSGHQASTGESENRMTPQRWALLGGLGALPIGLAGAGLEALNYRNAHRKAQHTDVPNEVQEAPRPQFPVGGRGHQTARSAIEQHRADWHRYALHSEAVRRSYSYRKTKELVGTQTVGRPVLRLNHPQGYWEEGELDFSVNRALRDLNFQAIQTDLTTDPHNRASKAVQHAAEREAAALADEFERSGRVPPAQPAPLPEIPNRTVPTETVNPTAARAPRPSLGRAIGRGAGMVVGLTAVGAGAGILASRFFSRPTGAQKTSSATYQGRILNRLLSTLEE